MVIYLVVFGLMCLVVSIVEIFSCLVESDLQLLCCVSVDAIVVVVRMCCQGWKLLSNQSMAHTGTCYTHHCSVNGCNAHTQALVILAMHTHRHWLYLQCTHTGTGYTCNAHTQALVILTHTQALVILAMHTHRHWLYSPIGYTHLLLFLSANDTVQVHSTIHSVITSGQQRMSSVVVGFSL